jgi:hypothetical protein
MKYGRGTAIVAQTMRRRRVPIEAICIIAPTTRLLNGIQMFGDNDMPLIVTCVELEAPHARAENCAVLQRGPDVFRDRPRSTGRRPIRRED